MVRGRLAALLRLRRSSKPPQREIVGYVWEKLTKAIRAIFKP